MCCDRKENKSNADRYTGNIFFCQSCKLWCIYGFKLHFVMLKPVAVFLLLQLHPLATFGTFSGGVEYFDHDHVIRQTVQVERW